MEKEDSGAVVEEYSENPFVSRFEGFLKAKCMKGIERLLKEYPEKRSLNIDFHEIEHYDHELADELLVNPDYLIDAAKDAISKIDIPALDVEEFRPNVRVYNLPVCKDMPAYKDCRPALRKVSAEHLSKMISVDGVVRAMTDVRPKLTTALWECRRCGNRYSLIQAAQQITQPFVCECKHREFNLVEKESKFIDWQKLQVQEPLELLRGNEQPTIFSIYVTDDLVNRVTPGDRVIVTGILRLKIAKERSQDKGLVYDKFLEGIHIEKIEREFEEVEITKDEETELRRISKDPKVYEMLRGSIAPDIYGHEIIKDAIVLQLFGGAKKTLPDGSYTRGNIHMLLVGDPGVAKSKLLQATKRIAPKSIYVAGKMASGAGLAATAVKDEFGEGGWTIKAGALVLASGGMVMIDEFEKMADEDRGALHEALEQQTCSVAKAGIVTHFKTETSVLAAANPKFFRFDEYMELVEQINMPQTLISRFDILFIMKDVQDRDRDRNIAMHILKTHQAGQLTTQAIRSGKKQDKCEIEFLEPKIAPDLMKKYISYARQNVFPVLGNDKMKALADFYLDLRSQGGNGRFTATHRQLEALIRLSEASARVRLSDIVEDQDIERALNIFRTSLDQFATDKSGKLDIDLITTGQSHTKTQNLKTILAIVKSKAVEQDEVTRDEVIDEAKARGIDAEQAKELISQLLRAGDLYMPRHGILQPVDKR